MSTVTLSIGPKSYTVVCADGQEAHIRSLGAMIAERYAQLGSARAPLEAQNLLFSALFLADELAELRKRTAPASATAPESDASELDALRKSVAALEAELAATRAAEAAPATNRSVEAPEADAAAQALAERLEALAAQAEASAAALEAGATSA